MSLQKYLAAGLGPRVLTGIILLAVVFTAWKAGGFPLFLLLLAVCCAGQWELYSLFLPNAELAAKLFGVLLGAGLVAQCRFLPEYSAGLALTASFALLAVHSLAGWTQETALARFRRAAILLGGIVYVPLLLSPALHYSPGEQLLVVAVPALSDIAAYAAGVQFGRRRIWPSVSPKKSVEGAAAGLQPSPPVSPRAGCSGDRPSPSPHGLGWDCSWESWPNWAIFLNPHLNARSISRIRAKSCQDTAECWIVSTAFCSLRPPSP